MKNKIEKILNRLTLAVKGTDKEYYEEEELTAFANSFQEVWSEDMDDNMLVNGFLDYWLDTDKPCRRCDVCGELMRDGFCYDMGRKFFCSENCLHTEFHDDEEWQRECDDGLQSYYTTWY